MKSGQSKNFRVGAAMHPEVFVQLLHRSCTASGATHSMLAFEKVAVSCHQ